MAFERIIRGDPRVETCHAVFIIALPLDANIFTGARDIDVG